MVSCEITQMLRGTSYHGFNIRVRNGIKLLILQLIIRADVNISTTVLGRVAVSGGREDYNG